MCVNREIDRDANGYTLDTGKMTLGARIDRRRIALGISQAELARRVGIRQSTINSLINGDSRSSRSITQIARVLGTTPSYLMGETDDPDENAPPPPSAPMVQHITMNVALPSEAALTRMFAGMIDSMPGVERHALARELAVLLPTALGNMQVPLVERRMDSVDGPSVQLEDGGAVHSAQRRA